MPRIGVSDMWRSRSRPGLAIRFLVFYNAATASRKTSVIVLLRQLSQVPSSFSCTRVFFFFFFLFDATSYYCKYAILHRDREHTLRRRYSPHRTIHYYTYSYIIYGRSSRCFIPLAEGHKKKNRVGILFARHCRAAGTRKNVRPAYLSCR